MARQDKMNDLDDRERVKSTLHLAREHLSRCQRLINELKQLQSFLVSQKMENIVDIRVFQSHVSAELKSLHKVRESSLAFLGLHLLIHFLHSIWRKIQQPSVHPMPFIPPIFHFNQRFGTQRRLPEV